MLQQTGATGVRLCTSVRYCKIKIPSPTQESPLQLNTGVRRPRRHVILPPRTTGSLLSSSKRVLAITVTCAAACTPSAGASVSAAPAQSVGATPGSVQHDVPRDTLAMTVVPGLPARALVLVLVDAEQGRPVEGAAVRVRGTDRGALTNALGWTRIPLEPEDFSLRRVIEVRRVGYAPQERTLPSALIDPHGIALFGRLRPSPATTCPVILSPPVPAFRIWVHDLGESVSLALRASASARPSAGETSAAATKSAPDSTGRFLELDVSEPGFYDIEVRAPGYAPWRQPATFAGGDGCRDKITRELRAWLAPASGRSQDR